MKTPPPRYRMAVNRNVSPHGIESLAYTPSQEYAGVTTQGTPCATKAEAEDWLRRTHTSYLMQRLIEVNTPQPH